MAVFEAPKGYHFSEDGLTPWAHFKREPGPQPGTYVFRFETSDPKVIERLTGVAGVTRVDTPAAAPDAKGQPKE
ncbi:hypothetical protein [Mycobacterium malmoense]|uniref:hypothetical protein n=1 Tax=Mycobacterium malmoense TaxID=1780 RepID=UPI0008F83B24|nr:hypothetical protein [Mycobacterium malmoense]OIN80874.1 hypothetical protein BMG05_11105 [Mycobacterium malmoense]